MNRAFNSINSKYKELLKVNSKSSSMTSSAAASKDEKTSCTAHCTVN